MKTCQHIDYDNKRDCEEEAVVVCLCCGAAMCGDHGRGNCPFGGEPFEELE